MLRGIRLMPLCMVLLGVVIWGRADWVSCAQLSVSREQNGSIHISGPKGQTTPPAPGSSSGEQGPSSPTGPADKGPATPKTPGAAPEDKRPEIPPEAKKEFEALQQQYEQRTDELQNRSSQLYGLYLTRMEELKRRKDAIEAELEAIDRIAMHREPDQYRFYTLKKKRLELQARQSAINDEWSMTQDELKRQEKEINDWRKYELQRIIQKYAIPPELVQMP